MNDLLTEITTERYYALRPAAFNAYRNNIMRGDDAKRGQREEKRRSFARFAEGQLVTKHHQLTDFRAYDEEWDEDGDTQHVPSEDVKYINIMRLTGPITRGGGECSYGSIEMRDEMMEAADRDDVIAHVFYTRTPGGAASALLDFRKAIEYARSRGQKVYMYCDGTVASCGTFLSAMCDGVYAYNENDEIGSIGLYIAYMGMPAGAVNAETQETYVEVYASKSKEKNLADREAMKGNLEPIQREADEYLDMLLNNLRADRPSITDEEMEGAMYKMKDAVGTIIDGITTLPELCEMIYKEWALTSPATSSTATDDDNQASINPNNNQMKEFKNIALALGYEEPVASQTDDHLSLQPHEAEAMDGKLGELMASVETLTTDNTQLKEREVALNASLATAIIERDAARKEAEELKAAAETTEEAKVAAVREEMQASIDTLTAEKATLEQSKAAVEAQLLSANNDTECLKKSAEEAATQAANQLAEKEQIIADLQAQLAEAQSGIEHKVNAGESPASNGQAAAPGVMTDAPAWDPHKTAAENMEAMQNYLDEQRKKLK